MPAGIGIASGEDRLKVLIVTDAWAPQVNGVVRTLEMLGRDLRSMGHEVRYATPEGRFAATVHELGALGLYFLSGSESAGDFGPPGDTGSAATPAVP